MDNDIFVVDETVPGAVNLIMLCKVQLDLDGHIELPADSPSLFLQVHNCGENKNKAHAFLTNLVWHVFRKITS